MTNTPIKSPNILLTEAVTVCSYGVMDHNHSATGALAPFLGVLRTIFNLLLDFLIEESIKKTKQRMWI